MNHVASQLYYFSTRCMHYFLLENKVVFQLSCSFYGCLGILDVSFMVQSRYLRFRLLSVHITGSQNVSQAQVFTSKNCYQAYSATFFFYEMKDQTCLQCKERYLTIPSTIVWSSDAYNGILCNHTLAFLTAKCLYCILDNQNNNYAIII